MGQYSRYSRCVPANSEGIVTRCHTWTPAWEYCADMSGMPLAERAINEYWDVTLEKGRRSSLRLIQNDYIEKKLRGE